MYIKMSVNIFSAIYSVIIIQFHDYNLLVFEFNLTELSQQLHSRHITILIKYDFFHTGDKNSFRLQVKFVGILSASNSKTRRRNKVRCREFLRRIEEESDLPPRIWCINHRRWIQMGPDRAPPSPPFVIKIHLPTIHGSLFLARRLWFFRCNVAGLAPLLGGTMGPHGWLMTIVER